MTSAHDPLPRLLSLSLCYRVADQLIVAAVPILGAVHFGLGPREIGWMIAAQGSAWLFFSLFAGVMVDRASPLRMLGMAMGLSVSGFLLVVWGYLGGHVALFTFGAFITACAAVLGFLAEGASVQRLVEGADLPRINGRIQIIQSIAVISGPFVIGWLVAHQMGVAGLLLALGLAAMGWLVSRALPSLAPLPPRPRQPLAEVAEGIRFVAAQPLLRGIMACALFWNTAMFALAAFFVPLAIQRFAMGLDGVGAAQAMLGVGSLLAAFSARTLLTRFQPRFTLFFGPASSVVAAALLFAAPMFGGVATSGVVYLLLGFGPILWFVCQNTIRQLVTPPGLLGRVGAVIQLAMYGVRSVGAVLGGWVASRYGFDAVLWLVISLFALSTVVIPLSALGKLAKMPDILPLPTLAPR
jgi:predicted MFS family arabinose efflux permease